MNIWQNDWEKFVQEVVKHHIDGMHKEEIATLFIGNKVTWSGIVRNNELGQENTNGIALDMPDIKIRLLDDSLIVANYIFLSMETSKLEYWREFSPGDHVTFTTETIESQSNFPEVEVSICSNNPEIIVALGTANAEPVLY
jgi:hypothetical protein